MVDRTTRQVRSIVIPDMKRATLQDALKALMHPGSMIVSDGLRAYEGLKDLFAGHERVDHGAKDGKRFRDGEASTNNNESFFSLIKNAILGTLKHVSTRHASRYVDESVFRWNTSRMTDGDRFQHMIWGCEGRSLFLNSPKGPSFERHPLRENYLVRRPAQAMLERVAWRSVSWRRGVKGRLKARFAAVRARVADGPPQRIGSMGAQHLPGEEVWLIGEHRASGERKFHLTNLPADVPLKRLAGTIKAR